MLQTGTVLEGECERVQEWGSFEDGVKERQMRERACVRAGLAVLGGWLLGVGGAVATAAPVDLKVEHRVTPLGVGVPRPMLSWRSDDTERGWRQAAYRIEVASSPELLSSGRPDLWDSGRVNSAESLGVVYGGQKLESGQRCWWSVETWDGAGHTERSANGVWWEMGLLEPADWAGAQWVGRDDTAQREELEQVRWISLPGQDARTVPAGQVGHFRYNLHLDAMPENAELHVLTGGEFRASVNGHATGHKNQWASFDREDVRAELHAGRGAAGDNRIEISAEARTSRTAGETFPSALAVVLEMRDGAGVRHTVVSDASWMAEGEGGGQSRPAAVVGPLDALKVSVGSDRETLLAAPDRIDSGVSLLRGRFLVDGRVRSARLYVTAMGAYRAFVNGQRVGDDVLTPGFTDFRKRVLYQTYDVSTLLRPGANVLGAELAAGWHGSPLLWSGVREFPGPDLLRAELVVMMEDGSRKVVVTDGRWESAEAPTRSAEIYGGERYDARMEEGLLTPEGGEATGARTRRGRQRGRSGVAAGGAQRAVQWTPVMQGAVDRGVEVSAQPDQGIERRQMLTPVSSAVVKGAGAGEPSRTVYDMGQNMVGAVHLRVRGRRGAMVRLRFAERLNPDGSVYTENLRNAEATDEYTLRGGGDEEWTPAFTFHGFRYVEATVYDAGAGTSAGGGGTPAAGQASVAIAGEVWNSLPERPSMQFHSSSELLNSMYELGLWGQRGNFVSVPTDCPQRDERLGWMGDAGVFWRTGTYNFDTDPFSQKFMNDVLDAQTEQGVFSNISPNLLLLGPEGVGAPGWGDAGILVPYATWMQYGDRALLERSWPAMVRWMAFVERSNPEHLRLHDLGPNYGDWLAPDPHTPKDLVGTAYWALVLQQMQEMGTALGRTEEVARYGRLYEQVRSAYRARYVHADGTVEGDTQTGYVLTLYAGLADKGERRGMTDRLVLNIDAHGGHLSTGFLGTPFLLFVLDAEQRTDVAFRLLLSDSYPSWGYMVRKGATTWWERWNGDNGDPSMNSYNHYAFGSVMAWVYRRVSGIDTDTTGTGFHHVVIAPRGSAGLASAESRYESAYGPVETRWTRAANGTMHLEVTLPANTSATVRLPRAGAGEMLEDGQPVRTRTHADELEVEMNAGRSVFETR